MCQCQNPSHQLSYCKRMQQQTTTYKKDMQVSFQKQFSKCFFQNAKGIFYDTSTLA